MKSSPLEQVVLISVDGMWPSLTEARGDHGSGLAELAQLGARARKAIPVYPTLTYVNHASIATGAWPNRHGISANTDFSSERVRHWRGWESQDWELNARAFRVPPIWQAAEDSGLSTALIRWPSTVGAHVQWLIPDIFSPLGERPSWELMKETSTPGLLEEMRQSLIFKPPDENHHDLDRFACDAAIHLLKRHKPRLMLLHLTGLDHEAHEHGTNSPLLASIASDIATFISGLRACLDPERSMILVFGDHGMLDFTRRVHINTIFSANGWIDCADGKIRDWRAIAHTNCSIAPIYLRDPSLGARVLETLAAVQDDHFRIVSRTELDRLHAFPEALCVVECERGYSLGQNIDGPLIEELAQPRGEHGYSAEYEEMNAGFFAIGAGIRPGTDLGDISLLDIAPTVARLLRIRLPDADGKPISPLFKSLGEIGPQSESRHL